VLAGGTGVGDVAYDRVGRRKEVGGKLTRVLLWGKRRCLVLLQGYGDAKEKCRNKCTHMSGAMPMVNKIEKLRRMEKLALPIPHE